MKFRKFCVTILLLLMTVSVLAGCNKTPVETMGATDPEVTTAEDEVVEMTEPTVAMSELKMTYLSVMLPEQDLDDIIFDSVTDGNSVMEIFSLKQDTGAVELFRVFYGKEEYGNRIGVLNVEGKALPVSVSPSNYDDSFFADKEASNRYYEMMEYLNLIVGAIQADSRFSSDEGNTIDKVETQVAEWNFQLPELVQWEEIRNEDSVKLTFYAKINGNNVELYALSIGDETMQSVLGQYKFNGKMMPISIGVCPSPDMEGWAEKEITTYYQLMDSINDVIQTILADENFSQEAG